ncbi:glycosyltransferase, partial [Cyclobacteriaceae bacterium]|nr:glycosyltransferase [Cyclobacteriaceae bacterium]
MNKSKHNPTVYYFSDCTFFAGCENMIANFLNDHNLSNKYNLRLVYRNTIPYRSGLSKRLNCNLEKTIPIRLLNQIDYHSSIKLLRVLLKVFYIPHKFFTIIINIIILFGVFKREKIDILHINNGGYPAAISCYSAVFAAKICGIKRIVYVVNNLGQPYNNIVRHFDKPLDKLITKYVNMFITSSKAAGKTLVDILDIPDGNYITINNGISKREITQNKDDFKSANNIPNDKVLFTTIANFENRKGHRYLLEAIKSLKMQNDIDVFHKIHFLFEGKGPEKLVIADYIKQINLEEKVQILDAVEDIYNLYNVTDVLILPSIGNEDFPNVVLEAMSLGKPVIGTDIAGIPEQINNMVTGIVIQPKNARDIQ